MTDPLNFQNIRILIVGDVMLDRYWWGDVNRISPEAPVPIIRLNRSTLVAGGAANVAANVAGLGAAPILVGCVGQDTDAESLIGLLEEQSISAEHLVKVEGRPTTVKTRIIAHSQQVARVDHEIADSLSESDETKLLDVILGQLGRSNAVVISDYAKGVLSDTVVEKTIAAAKEKGLPVVVDPKGRDYSKYRGATLLTPNRKEAAEACNIDEGSNGAVEVSGKRLLGELEVDAVLITQGEEGMTLFSQGLEPVRFATAALDVFDVTGAGDTVIATLAVSLAGGRDLAAAAQLANEAAGYVVGHIGTTPIRLADLNNEGGRTNDGDKRD
jgi:D-beta-D-heptose 7-phosphate kinase/D-beta-D-heptose 1-phosphate adenosyltransferase